MTGLRGFDGNVGGFEIANLTDHDDVRILTQESLQCGGKGQAGLLIDVDLVDTRQVDLRRIFRR